MRHVVRRSLDARRKPLSEPVFLILTSLAHEPKHGYALIKDIEELSHRTVRLSTGTLYGAIRRLIEAEWIEPFDQEDSSREKQAYALTVEGRRQLAAYVDRMKQLAREATARLKTKRV